MKKRHFYVLIAIALLCVSCKVKQVDMSKVYDSCWVDNSGGLDSELCFYKNHTAKFSSTSIAGGEKINSVVMYTYNHVNGKIYLNPNTADFQYAKLYAIFEGDIIKIYSTTKKNMVFLERKKNN